MQESLDRVRAFFSTHRRHVGVRVVLFVVDIALAAWLSSPEASVEPSAPPETTPAESPLPSPSPSSSPSLSAETLALRPGEIIGTLARDQLPVYAVPGDAQAVQRLGKWTTALTLLPVMAIDTDEVDGTTWLRVLLPLQPNNSTGWIRQSDVTVTSTTLQIHIYLAERVLELTDGDSVVLTADVAIGTEETPTPPGVYSVTDRLEYPNPDHAYGAFALGLPGFSEVLDSFQGAPPQLAIHGTNQPQLIGDRVSNGCIRLPNEVVLELAAVAQLGTPVVIHESRAPTLLP